MLMSEWIYFRVRKRKAEGFEVCNFMACCFGYHKQKGPQEIEEEEKESDAASKQSPREVKEAKRREKMARERRHAKDFTFKSLKNFWNKV